MDVFDDLSFIPRCSYYKVHALLMIKGLGVAPTLESHPWKIYRCSGDAWSQLCGITNKQSSRQSKAVFIPIRTIVQSSIQGVIYKMTKGK